MEPKRAIDEQLIARYLLGDLPEEQQRQLEEQYFTDETCFELLLAVEDELFSDYAQGKLSPSERAQFERRFLTSSEGRQRLAFAETVARAIVPKKPNRLRFALAATVVLAVSGAGWLFIKYKNLNSQVAQLQAEQQNWQRRQQDWQQQLAQQRQHNDELTKRFQQGEKLIARLQDELARQVGPAIVSFVLPSGSVRGINEPRQVPIPLRASSVRLQLEGEGEYTSYRVQLRTAAGQEVWDKSGLPARSTAEGPVVIINLPARVLSPGDYELELRGVTAQGDVDVIDYYRFSVVRR
jgi:hypothetical protein